MDRKYDAVDWQSFSQKKDVEEIVKNTREKNSIQIATTIEIAMAVLSLMGDNIFKNETPYIFSLSIMIISVGVLLYLCFMMLLRWYKQISPGADIPKSKLMIDLFDNDICYYALMAESYCDKMKNNDITLHQNLKQFYFMETCFYINKAIYNLSISSNCVDNLYSINSKELYCNRKISYTRLKNIFNILDQCIEDIEPYYDVISDIDINSNYLELCNGYKKSYNQFKKLFIDIDCDLNF